MAVSDLPAELGERVRANVATVRGRIAAAAERAGRDPASVRLVAVTKTMPAALCAAALTAGIAELGENRVQEGVAKAAALAAAGSRPCWHLLGHLQSNKMRPALATFGMIQSLDSLRLAEAISRAAGGSVAVLLEVNVAGEASKFGFSPDEVGAAYERIAALRHLNVRGLMTVAPQTDDAETVRPVFRRLRELGDTLSLPELSMGMSGDYEVAIEEGATMVRVGRALFGPRPEREATG